MTFRLSKQVIEVRSRMRNVAGSSSRSWYRIRNAEDGVATVYIYDEIGFFGISADDFVRDFDAITAPQIDVRINSPGGDVFDGWAIYNAIKRHPSSVTTHIDALAASIASLIALAGERTVMAETSFFMIHKPWVLAIGDADDLREVADTLDKITDRLTAVYASKTGMIREDIEQAMRDETWYDASEAPDAGFVDEIEGGSSEKAAFDLSVFRHAPAGLGGGEQPTERDLEAVLRDAGYSRNESKRMVAAVRTADLRDAGLHGDEDQRDAEIVAQINTLQQTLKGALA